MSVGGIVLQGRCIAQVSAGMGAHETAPTREGSALTRETPSRGDWGAHKGRPYAGGRRPASVGYEILAILKNGA